MKKYLVSSKDGEEIEFDKMNAAVSYCRKHGINDFYRIVKSSSDQTARVKLAARN